MNTLKKRHDRACIVIGYYEENGNYRTEVYKPTYEGNDIYLYMVIVQESEDWMSDRIEEIKYFEDGSIEYHKQK